MKFSVFTATAAIAGMSHVLMGYVQISRTSYGALYAGGIFLEPTPAPYLHPYRRHQLLKRAGLNSCAWLGTSALSCGSEATCATSESYWGCGVTPTDGDVLSGGSLITSCVNQVQSSSLCSGSNSPCLGPLMLVWYVIACLPLSSLRVRYHLLFGIKWCRTEWCSYS